MFKFSHGFPVAVALLIKSTKPTKDSPNKIITRCSADSNKPDRDIGELFFREDANKIAFHFISSLANAVILAEVLRVNSPPLVGNLSLPHNIKPFGYLLPV